MILLLIYNLFVFLIYTSLKSQYTVCKQHAKVGLVNRSEATVTIRFLDTVNRPSYSIHINCRTFCLYNSVGLSSIKYYPTSSTLTDTFRNLGKLETV